MTPAVADDEDVRHRAQHALDELLRLLERGVLVLERHLVLKQVVETSSIFWMTSIQACSPSAAEFGSSGLSAGGR